LTTSSFSSINYIDEPFRCDSRGDFLDANFGACDYHYYRELAPGGSSENRTTPTLEHPLRGFFVIGIHPMKKIAIYDTTLRDGSQGEGVNFSMQDKLQLTAKLDDLGVDYIEGGYPLSNPKDAEYFQAMKSRTLKHAKLVAFGMTRRKGIAAKDDHGIKALLDGGTPVVTIVGKTWDLHVRDILGTDLEENLAMIADSVATCKAAGREVFYDAEHFFDGFTANPEYALRTLKAAQDAGATCAILCDTNGGTMPERVAECVKIVKGHLKCDVGIHCHNDCELAVANTLAAVREGATQVQGTMNGIGERCGNVDLVSVIANLTLKYGYECLKPGSLTRLTEASRYVYEVANMNFRNGQPFVGMSAFAHKGGMHTHAVAKNPVSYEHIDPARVGNERRILISELSGQSTVLTKTTKYEIQHDKATMQKILHQVMDLENAGYEFEAAEASFDILVKKAIGQYTPWFERVHYRVNIEQSTSGTPVTEATVKLKVGNDTFHTASDGDGPVNAIDSALRKALLPVYPQLESMQLVDYKVRVVNAKEGTAARVRVVIESRDDKHVWGTVGVSENIIEASWMALIDAVEYKLFREKESEANA
jgi:2-isopropylmalate synthase